MKKELLKKLKYDMPKKEMPAMEIELGMEDMDGEEDMLAMEEEGMEEAPEMEEADLSMFSEEELMAELERRKKPEMEEEEMA